MEAITISRHDFFRLVGASLGVVLLTHYSMGCSETKDDEPAPVDQKVDFILYLADKASENLRTSGGYVVVNDIIIAKTDDGQFIAVSATCTCVNPGTQLVYKPADKQFYCPLHLSRFSSTGNVLMGPATQPLVRYLTVVDEAAGTIRVHS